MRTVIARVADRAMLLLSAALTGCLLLAVVAVLVAAAIRLGSAPYPAAPPAWTDLDHWMTVAITYLADVERLRQVMIWVLIAYAVALAVSLLVEVGLCLIRRWYSHHTSAADSPTP